MKVFSCPTEIAVPQIDFANFNREKMLADEQAHQQAVKTHIINLGYNGPKTGETVSFPVADGHALYMFADGGAKSALIHLPYGDAYNYRDVEFLPRKEILKRIDQQAALNEIFSQKAKTPKP